MSKKKTTKEERRRWCLDRAISTASGDASTSTTVILDRATAFEIHLTRKTAVANV